MKKRRKSAALPNPYHLLLRELARAHVDYLVIGVSGINYFATDARQILSTADYDLFLRPTPENVMRAWKAFRKGGFTVVIKKGDHTMTLHRLTAKMRDKLVREQRTLIAMGPYRLVTEGLLAVSGFTFEEMQKHAVWMRDRELSFRFPVGSLTDLLESKRVADREKDRLFLARYKRLLLDG